MKKILLIALLTISGQLTLAQTLSFVNKADMPTARAGFSGVYYDNFEYVSNGFSATAAYTSEIEKYDFTNNVWSTLTTSIPTIGKRYGNAQIINGVLYLYNGATANGNNNKLEIIELGTGNVTVSSSLNPSPVYGAGSASYGDYALSFGGCVSEWEGIYSNKFYKISPDGEWTALADMPVAVQTKGAVVYGNGNDTKLYAFGGYNQIAPLHGNFETVATTGNLALTDWINTSETSSVLFQGKSFGNNKYAQVTAFNPIVEEQATMAESWLISPNINVAPGSYLTFDTKDGYDNGATLQAYLVTNWTGDINTSSVSLLPANISSGHTTGYASNFTSSGVVALNGAVGNNRIAFKYTGGYSPLATTTYQLDNVRLYSEYKSYNLYVYDFNTNTWTTNWDVLPLAVSSHAVALDNPFTDSKVYVTGDYDNQTFLSVYDTTSNSFTTLNQTNMIGRRHHGAEIFDNKLYLFGGNTTGQAASCLNSTQSASLTNLATNGFERTALSFSPNPANEKITFNTKIQTASIYTLDGKKINTELINDEINVSNLTTGIYLIQYSANGKTVTEKLIKQ